MDREQAIKMAESEWWKDLDSRVIVAFQLFEDRLCMDFGDLHKALEECLCRPVFTHEFANIEMLRAEFHKESPPKSLQEVLEMIPEEKRIILVCRGRQ